MPWTTGALPQRDPVTELRRRVPKYLIVPVLVEMDAVNRALRTANVTGMRQASRPSGSELGQDHLGDRGRQLRSLVLAGRDHLAGPAAAAEHDHGRGSCPSPRPSVMRTKRNGTARLSIGGAIVENPAEVGPAT